MRRLIFFSVFFLSALVANAQDITEKDLLGQWKIVSISESELQLDFIANTAKITEQFVTDNPEHSLEELEEMANDRLNYLRELCVTFKPGSVLLITCNNEEPASFGYKLITKGNKQYIRYTATGDLEEVYIKNNLLYKILATGETGYIEVYKKENP